MFVTHTEQKADKEKGLAAVPAGVLFPNRSDAEPLIAAGLADERIVRCTKKHYVNEKKTVVIGERQVIDNVDHALRALAGGMAVIEPPLGESVKIKGVVAGDKFHPIETFNPFPKKPKKAAAKTSQKTPETTPEGAGAASADQPAA